MLTYREWLKAGNRTNDAASLKAYVDEVPGEWWNRELKLCEEDVDYGVRKTVAALGNDRGGEAFIGVTEAREIPGSAVTHERLAQVLRQPEGPRSAWFTSDLTRAVSDVTPVPVSEKRTAYVLEVAQQWSPLVVRDERGRLWIHFRNGSESARLGGFESLEWYRGRRRAEILRTIYVELKIMSERFVPWNHFPPTFDPPLPFFMEMAQSGVLYQYLEAGDLAFLLGGPSEGGARRQGVLEPLLTFLRKAEAAVEDMGPDRVTTIERTDNSGNFANYAEGLRSAVRDFRGYLETSGIMVEQ